MLKEDKPIEKVYYTIGEVATMFNLTVSNVRFWETEFDILMPKKNARGDRFFTKKDIENLRLIHHLLKERGYTIDGAKKKLKESRNEIQDRLDMMKSLEKIKSFLVAMKEELDRKPVAEELNVVGENTGIGEEKLLVKTPTMAESVAEDVTPEVVAEVNEEVVAETESTIVGQETNNGFVAELSREITNETDREINTEADEVPLIDEINAEVKEESLHRNSLPPISPDLFSSTKESEEQIRTGRMPGDEFVD